MCQKNLVDHGDQKLPLGLSQIPVPAKNRLRYWEVEPHFRCPVVGMCLTLDEQKRLLKKSGIKLKSKTTPYMIHELCVAYSDEENSFSEKLDSLLNRKYASQIQSLTELDETTFMDYWKRVFRSGDYVGAFWVAVTRRDLSPETRRDVFAAIHMSMHENADIIRKLNSLITREKDRADDLRKKVRKLGSEAGSLNQENRRLKSDCVMLKRRISSLENEKGAIEAEYLNLKDRKVVHELEMRIGRLETEKQSALSRYSELERRFRNVEKENQNLVQALEKERAELDVLKTETREVMEELVEINSCDQACPSFDLCKRRILIVGGMSRMEDLYRKFIEERGGIFDYHDGYVKRGVKTLEERLKRADIVLCPVSCNSHAACSFIKNMGKKHRKPIHFLFNSSLNAISQALSQKGAGHGIQH